MNIKPEESATHDYVLLDQLGHKDLVPFIRTYLKKKTLFSVFYYLFNGLAFGLVAYFFLRDHALPDYSVGERFTRFSYGLALAFAMLPLHEYIHMLAYRSQGAKNTSYAANPKKLFFMALADRFVASKKEFEIVALAPFIVISTLLIFCLLLLNPAWRLTVSSVLLAHTAMCSGDFGLLSYFAFHKNRQPVTYDDVAQQVSYFYGRREGTQAAS